MAQAEKKSSTSEQAAKPASEETEEIIPILVVETFGFNEQGQYVKKTSTLRFSESTRQPPKQPKKDRFKPKQALVQLDLLRHFPDGKVPDEMSTGAVRERIGRKHSWDTVNRALGREPPKK
jgi:hypothetical protein